MNSISPWATAAGATFADDGLPVLYSHTTGIFTFNVHSTNDSLWITAEWPKGGRMLFRAAYTPAGDLQLGKIKENGSGVDFTLASIIGQINVNISFVNEEQPILRYTTTLDPRADMTLPFWPRDIIVPGKDGNPENTAGKIHVSQVGTRSGLIYMTMTRPKAGSVLYMQNLTALADYCQETETSAYLTGIL
ncbi:MAG: hypothetical protein EOP47_21300, partial [Sphingobacteriaceae bacterium]